MIHSCHSHLEQSQRKEVIRQQVDPTILVKFVKTRVTLGWLFYCLILLRVQKSVINLLQISTHKPVPSHLCALITCRQDDVLIWDSKTNKNSCVVLYGWKYLQLLWPSSLLKGGGGGLKPLWCNGRVYSKPTPAKDLAQALVDWFHGIISGNGDQVPILSLMGSGPHSPNIPIATSFHSPLFHSVLLPCSLVFSILPGLVSGWLQIPPVFLAMHWVACCWIIFDYWWWLL